MTNEIIIVAIITIALIVACVVWLVAYNYDFNIKKEIDLHSVKHAPIPWYDADGNYFLIDDDYIKSQTDETRKD